MQELLRKPTYKGIDQTGKIYGGYQVIDFNRVHIFPSGRSHHFWNVRCLSCEQLIECQSFHVMENTKGCKSCYGKKMGSINSAHWKGGKYISGYFIAVAKIQAKNRHRGWNLSIEYLDKLWEKQNGKCIYTGWDINIGSNECEQTASLDRIDSNKDYIENNVQFVHKYINLMKWNHSEENFINLCKAVVEYATK